MLIWVATVIAKGCLIILSGRFAIRPRTIRPTDLPLVVQFLSSLPQTDSLSRD